MEFFLRRFIFSFLIFYAPIHAFRLPYDSMSMTSSRRNSISGINRCFMLMGQIGAFAGKDGTNRCFLLEKMGQIGAFCWKRWDKSVLFAGKDGRIAGKEKERKYHNILNQATLCWQ